MERDFALKRRAMSWTFFKRPLVASAPGVFEGQNSGALGSATGCRPGRVFTLEKYAMRCRNH